MRLNEIPWLNYLHVSDIELHHVIRFKKDHQSNHQSKTIVVTKDQERNGIIKTNNTTKSWFLEQL